jgi:hypothetical protein
MTTEHKCSVCQCDFTDDEGGVHGEFGIIPVSFCPTCLSCMCDMVEQLDAREWEGLTDEDKQDWIKSMPWPPEHRHIRILIDGIESELKEKNERAI